MEDPQAAYYPPYAFDLDLMKVCIHAHSRPLS